jgi:hypothetical protein
MGNHAVALRVAPFLRIECKFWLTDDGWNGSCEQPSITVQREALNTRDLRWKSRSVNMLSPSYASPSEQVLHRLLEGMSGRKASRHSDFLRRMLDLFEQPLWKHMTLSAAGTRND